MPMRCCTGRTLEELGVPAASGGDAQQRVVRAYGCLERRRSCSVGDNTRSRGEVPMTFLDEKRVNELLQWSHARAVTWYRTCARKLTQDSTRLLLVLLAVSEAARGSVLVDDSRKSTLLDVVTSEFLLSRDKGYRDPTLWVATLNVFVAARDEDRVNELLQRAHARKPKNLAFLQRRLTAFLAEMRSSESSRPTAASASEKAAQSAATREVVVKCR
ncbi:hypothetical protein DIPPA_10304 [Diplonema papillatum]|nr:hypothetical protein DIPPA_10304 [Diplonema papillatum]